MVPPTSRVPLPRTRDRMLPLVWPCRTALSFATAALVPQRPAAARCRCLWPSPRGAAAARRASARSMLSPPSRMCSPTATRSSVRSPSCSATAIRLKSVVPPPMSHTSTRSPTRTLRRQPSPERVDPGVERGLRLFEQRDVFETGRACRANRQLARLFVERCGNGQEDVLIAESRRVAACWCQVTATRRLSAIRTFPDISTRKPAS